MSILFQEYYDIHLQSIVNPQSVFSFLACLLKPPRTCVVRPARALIFIDLRLPRLAWRVCRALGVCCDPTNHDLNAGSLEQRVFVLAAEGDNVVVEAQRPREA